MEYKITYYTDGKLNLKRTAKSYAIWYAKYFFKFYVVPYAQKLDYLCVNGKLPSGV